MNDMDSSASDPLAPTTAKFWPDYRLVDAVSVPGLLSLSRIPLAFVFYTVHEQPLLSFGTLALAGLTDVLDGWYARKFGRVTATGALLDPAADKLFVFGVVVSLLAHGRLAPTDLLLLCARDIGEFPILLFFLLNKRLRHLRLAHSHQEQPKANFIGKLATTFQFLTVGWLLLRQSGVPILLWITGVFGAISAIAYLLREIAIVRKASAGPTPVPAHKT